MKNRFSELQYFKISISLLFFLFIITSCEYDNAGINALERPVSYSGDIVPLVRKNCAISGCHTGSAQTGNFIEYSEIKSRIDNGKFQLMVFDYRLMPPSGYPDLSELEMAKLRKWIDDGAIE